jgi:hypothetical protein
MDSKQMCILRTLELGPFAFSLRMAYEAQLMGWRRLSSPSDRDLLVTEHALPVTIRKMIAVVGAGPAPARSAVIQELATNTPQAKRDRNYQQGDQAKHSEVTSFKTLQNTSPRTT